MAIGTFSIAGAPIAGTPTTSTLLSLTSHIAGRFFASGTITESTGALTVAATLAAKSRITATAHVSTNLSLTSISVRTLKLLAAENTGLASSIKGSSVIITGNASETAYVSSLSASVTNLHVVQPPLNPYYVSTGAVSAPDGSGPLTSTPGLPPSVLPGDALVCWFAGGDSSGSTSFTINAPSGWTVVSQTQFKTAYWGWVVGIAVKIATASEPATYNFSLTGAGSNQSLVFSQIQAYRGVNQSNPVDTAGQSITYSTNITTPSLTPSFSNDTWASFFVNEATQNTPTVSSPLTTNTGGNQTFGAAPMGWAGGWEKLSAAVATGVGTATVPTAPSSGSDQFGAGLSLLLRGTTAVISLTALSTASNKSASNISQRVPLTAHSFGASKLYSTYTASMHPTSFSASANKLAAYQQQGLVLTSGIHGSAKLYGSLGATLASLSRIESAGRIAATVHTGFTSTALKKSQVVASAVNSAAAIAKGTRKAVGIYGALLNAKSASSNSLHTNALQGLKSSTASKTFQLIALKQYLYENSAIVAQQKSVGQWTEYQYASSKVTSYLRQTSTARQLLITSSHTSSNNKQVASLKQTIFAQGYAKQQYNLHSAALQGWKSFGASSSKSAVAFISVNQKSYLFSGAHLEASVLASGQFNSTMNSSARTVVDARLKIATLAVTAGSAKTFTTAVNAVLLTSKLSGASRSSGYSLLLAKMTGHLSGRGTSYSTVIQSIVASSTSKQYVKSASNTVDAISSTQKSSARTTGETRQIWTVGSNSKSASKLIGFTNAGVQILVTSSTASSTKSVSTVEWFIPLTSETRSIGKVSANSIAHAYSQSYSNSSKSSVANLKVRLEINGQLHARYATIANSQQTINALLSWKTKANAAASLGSISRIQGYSKQLGVGAYGHGSQATIRANNALHGFLNRPVYMYSGIQGNQSGVSNITIIGNWVNLATTKYMVDMEERFFYVEWRPID